MSEISGASEQLKPKPLFEFDFHGKHFSVREEAKRIEKNNSFIENLVVTDSLGNTVGSIHGRREKIAEGEQFTAFSSVNKTQDRVTEKSSQRGIIRETIIQAALQFFDKWRSSTYLNPATGRVLYEKISADPRVIVRSEEDEQGLIRQVVVRNPQP